MLSLPLAIAFAVIAPLQIPIAVPAGSSLPPSLQIEWNDKEGLFLREERVQVAAGRLSLAAPPGAEQFRIVGGGFASRAVSISDVAKLGTLGVEPTAIVSISGLRTKEGPGSVFWISPASSRPETPRFASHRPDPIRERKTSASDAGHGGALRLELPAGKYVLAFDEGERFVPAILPEFEVAPKALVAITVPEDAGRLLTVLARDRDSGKPLRDAKLVADAKAAPAERLLQTILQRRAGSSGYDGRLRLGQIPSREIPLTVAAPARRDATMLLRAGKEAENREVRLAPPQIIRVTLTGLPRSESRPVVVAGRCEEAQTWMPCRPKRTMKRPLDENDRAVITAAEPGVTRITLDWGGGREINRVVEVSSHSEDPDTLEIDVVVALSRFRGRTLLRDDRPIEATVLAHGNGNNASQYGETRSSADGGFDLSVYLPTGRENDVSLRASSDSPRGRGFWHPKNPVPWLYAGEDEIVIRIQSGEFRVQLRDRKSNDPVAHCRVQARVVGPNSGVYTSIESDDDGVATFSAIGSGAVHFLPSCEGYVHGTGTSFDFEESVPREETLLLDRAQDIILTIVDRDGIPVGNAHVQAQDVANYHGDNPHLHVNDYFGNVTDLGFSGPDGKMLIPGALWADVPFFAVASGKALTIGRFPSMESCEDGPDCTLTLVMPPPNAFPGILLRPSPSGRGVVSNNVFFETVGIPIPAPVFREAIAFNGFTKEGTFQSTDEGLLCLLPALLADGDYDVLVQGKFDPKSGAPLLRVGRVHVPATERLAITLPEDVGGPNN